MSTEERNLQTEANNLIKDISSLIRVCHVCTGRSEYQRFNLHRRCITDFALIAIETAHDVISDRVASLDVDDLLINELDSMKETLMFMLTEDIL